MAGLVAFSVRFFSGLAGLLLRRIESRRGVTNRVLGEVHGDVIQIGTVRGDLTIHCSCDGCAGEPE